MDARSPGFSAELLAPCGMNCVLCSAYRAYVSQSQSKPHMTRCAGCRARDKRCAYLKGNCEKIRLGKIGYCFECAGFPCERLKHLDERYRSNYSYSMIETLRSIKALGVEEVLKTQWEKYRCRRCGGVVCVHDCKCYTCDEVKSRRG